MVFQVQLNALEEEQVDVPIRPAVERHSAAHTPPSPSGSPFRPSRLVRPSPVHVNPEPSRSIKPSSATRADYLLPWMCP
jgi:hypothetical protein